MNLVEVSYILSFFEFSSYTIKCLDVLVFQNSRKNKRCITDLSIL